MEKLLETEKGKHTALHLLQREREQASSFPVEGVKTFLCGGDAKRRIHEQALGLLSSNNELRSFLNVKLTAEASPEERKVQIMDQIAHWKTYLAELQTKGVPEEVIDALFMLLSAADDGSFGMRFGVHLSLFRATIRSQGTALQVEKYIPAADNLEIFGCFAMTELGHSSHLPGLETTATFDAVSDEFIINTPTMTALKWWIGGAGQTATHTVVLCQLKLSSSVDAASVGLYWFMVPMREPKTGKLLDGVFAGDIGPKAGRNGIDNGWICFSNVRVPRENMLAKWAHVTRKGQFVPSGQKQSLSYATLIGERDLLIRKYLVHKKASLPHEGAVCCVVCVCVSFCLLLYHIICRSR